MTNRPIPELLTIVLKEQFSGLFAGDIDGDDVYLLMADRKGRPHHAVHYIASPDFQTAVRVADSGLDNLLMLVGKDGLNFQLLVPQDD
jgi:fructose 1,6-bisphosphatase